MVMREDADRMRLSPADPRPARADMKYGRAKLCLTVALSLAASVSACDDSPVSPAPPPPPAGPQARLTGLQILAPESIPPGVASQLTAAAEFSDGSSGEITHEAAWTINPWGGGQPVLSVSSAGLATAHRSGEATVQVSYQSLTASRLVFVLPDGTFRVGGTVTDDGVEVPGALVEEISRPGFGLSTTTDSGGGYRLYGVSRDLELRASKEGYEPRTQRATVTNQQARIDFGLVPSEPRPFWSGAYTLTISADPARCSALPQEVRTRTYAAVAEQLGPRIKVTLTGANFLVRFGTGDSFSGRVEPDRVVFELEQDNAYYSWYYTLFSGSIVELLTPPLVFRPSGTAVTSRTPSGLSGTLDGTIETFESPDFGLIASCQSQAHQFVLSR